MYKRTKYRNIKTVIDGIKFDSKKEAKRYLVLKDMHAKGEIQDLAMQVKFTFRIPDGDLIRYVDSNRVLTYIADFTYWKDMRLVVEDVKGIKTPDYKIKKALMRALNQIEISEV